MILEPKRIEGATLLCTLPTGATWDVIQGVGVVIYPVDAPAYHVDTKGYAREISAPGHA